MPFCVWHSCCSHGHARAMLMVSCKRNSCPLCANRISQGHVYKHRLRLVCNVSWQSQFLLHTLGRLKRVANTMPAPKLRHGWLCRKASLLRPTLRSKWGMPPWRETKALWQSQKPSGQGLAHRAPMTEADRTAIIKTDSIAKHAPCAKTANSCVSALQAQQCGNVKRRANAAL